MTTAEKYSDITGWLYPAKEDLKLQPKPISMTNIDKAKLQILTGAMKALIEQMKPSIEATKLMEINEKQEKILINDTDDMPDLIY